MKEIGCIVKRFDLVVVATPGNNFAGLFARDAALSPYRSRAAAFAGGPVRRLSLVGDAWRCPVRFARR